LIDTPAGSPLRVRLRFELNPPTGVMIMPTGVEVAPCLTVTVGLEKAIVKVGEAAVTLNATVAVLVRPPPAAVIVTVADPRAAVLEAENVTVLDPAPGAAMLPGTKLAVTPNGSPVAERVTAELKPPDGVTVRPTGTVPARETLTEDEATVKLRAGVGAVTVSVKVAVWTKPPPAAVIVTVADPAVALLDAENVSVLDPEPGAAMLAGAKVAVTPDGNPVAERVTAELNPPEGVTVRPTGTVPARATLTEDEATVKLRAGVEAVTVSATVVVFVKPPPAAVIVIVADPTVAVLDAENVSVLDPEPGAAMLAGTKLAVTPDGSPVAERVTAELNPPDGVTVRLTGAVPARATFTVEGVAVRASVGAAAVTVRATVAVFVTPPPVPVIVTVVVTSAAVLDAVKVTALAVKLAVTPEGRPEAENATVELNPPDGVTVRVA
jgi:hypothetical protein